MGDDQMKAKSKLRKRFADFIFPPLRITSGSQCVIVRKDNPRAPIRIRHHGWEQFRILRKMFLANAELSLLRTLYEIELHSGSWKRFAIGCHNPKGEFRSCRS
jgi:hypothetical protein